MSEAHYVTADDSWTLLEDYIYSWATYLVACPPDRRCQVGMGFFVGGTPLGEKIRFSGEREVLVIGAGSLRVRVDDGLGPCRVGFIQKDRRGIGFTWTFP